MVNIPHWADELAIREEVVERQGQISNLQMSLYKAVYKTADVPYEEVDYYADITYPTPGLVGFMAEVARRLGTTQDLKAAFHLDQGMGGGKSHALVGLYHMATSPQAFFGTELGKDVLTEAEQRANGPVDLDGTHRVVLSADNMSPGKPSPQYGPATTLHERFLWELIDGRNNRQRYDDYVARGISKAALEDALSDVDAPVLILLDEVMDYAMQLGDESNVGGMPNEQAFLSHLLDVVDDVPRVALVVVMISSDKDEHAYPEPAQEMRDYIALRLERNGRTVAVTEPQNFASIIRRRLFEDPPDVQTIEATASSWVDAADSAWRTNVFDRLRSTRGLVGFQDRLTETYPFHPDLMALVRDDWSRHAGFQRVRSTVEIFAATVYHWFHEHSQGRWAPPLIGVGDLPLDVIVEHVLSSGLLHGNDKAVQGFRSVAAGDVISKDGTGRAVQLDEQLAEEHSDWPEGRPTVRVATALFLYSLVARAGGKRGATKPEIASAVFQPGGLTYPQADEAFSLLTDRDGGLGSLEVIPRGSSQLDRYQLSPEQTLRMFYQQARLLVDEEGIDEFVWEQVQRISSAGSAFDVVKYVEDSDGADLHELFDDVDEQKKSRLVVLDPSRWSLLNGRDAPTRRDITAVLGLGDEPLRVDYAASCVIACVNTQRRAHVRRRAADVLAWRDTRRMVEDDQDLSAQADAEFRQATNQLEAEIKRAYQHFSYLIATEDGREVDFRRFDDDARTALSGNHVWDALVDAKRAVRSGGLSSEYLQTLLDLSDRHFTLDEVVRKFWQDPRFPLVPDMAEVRRVIFKALGDDGWELVGADGEVLTITNPDQLPVTATNVLVRPATPVTEEDEGDDGDGDGEEADTDDQDGETDEDVVYKDYVMTIPSKSLKQPETRQQLFQLLSKLTDAVDPTSRRELELFEMELKINAQEGQLDDLKGALGQVDGRWNEEVEEF